VSNRFEIIQRSVQEAESNNGIDLDDHLDSIREGRSRIRSIASMLLGVCGMLLSVCFLILFFLLREKPSGVPFAVFVLLFLTVGLLLLTLLSVILSVYVRAPLPAATKGARLLNQLTIYQREYQCSRISLILFIASILCFSSSLGVFASWAL
jgi:Na+/melibiose symporter-like transporter